MAQTHFQGPLSVTGSGKPLTKKDLEQVKAELEDLKAKYDLKEPDRAFMTETDENGSPIAWRFGGIPDYSLTNLQFLKERSRVHPAGSLELIVENLVKTWEMERSHKLDPNQHQSVDKEHFRISANGGKKFDNIEANEVGNYNVLLHSCPLWNKDGVVAPVTWEQSHDAFHDAFAAFPWEVLEVFSGPPKVAFTWRHWGHFTGTFDHNKGNGELVEVYGFGTAVVNDQLQLQDVEIFYNADEFMQTMRGDIQPVTPTKGDYWAAPTGCPFQGMVNAAKLLGK